MTTDELQERTMIDLDSNVRWVEPGFQTTVTNASRYCDGPRRGRTSTLVVADKTLTGRVVEIDGSDAIVRRDDGWGLILVPLASLTAC